MNDSRTRCFFRSMIPLGLVVLATSATGQEAKKTRIRDLGDILPASVARGIDETSRKRYLKTTQDRQVPIFVLVNPALKTGGKGGDLSKLIGSWSRKGKALPKPVVASLVGKQGNSPAIHSCLVEIGNDFFKLFFGSNVSWSDRLPDLITKQFFKGEVLIIACFDVKCRGEGTRIVADLSLKIYRVEVDRNKPSPQPIKRMELLFQDSALGKAYLPPTPTGKPASSYPTKIRDAYQSAVINALDRKIALSLWHNARMNEASWVSGKRKKIVTPSLTDSGKKRAKAGKGGKS